MFENTVAVDGGVGRAVADVEVVVDDEVVAVEVVEDELVNDVVEGAGVDGEAGSLVELEPDAAVVAELCAAPAL